MGMRVVATETQDVTVARRAIQAGLTVLQDSGLKGEGPAVDWSRVDFKEFRELLEAARLAIRKTMRDQYHRRELRTKSYHGFMLDLPELLLISAVQAWLAGGNSFQIHPFSASSYTWLAVSTFVAMRQLEDEHSMVRLDILEPDAMYE